RVAERHLAVGVLSGRRVTERHVRVERRVLEPRRRLDRGDDLARHAQLGEGAERRLLVGAKVAHGLVEPDQALLDQIVAVAADEEVRARLQPHERRVALDQRVERSLVAVASLEDELEILELSLSLLRALRGGCVTDGHLPEPPSGTGSGAADRRTLTLRSRWNLAILSRKHKPDLQRSRFTRLCGAARGGRGWPGRACR